MRQILALVAAEATRPVAAGIAGGITASLVAGRVLRAEFAQVTPSDPPMLAAACAILLAAAIVGCIAPARRAFARE